MCTALWANVGACDDFAVEAPHRAVLVAQLAVEHPAVAQLFPLMLVRGRGLEFPPESKPLEDGVGDSLGLPPVEKLDSLGREDHLALRINLVRVIVHLGVLLHRKVGEMSIYGRKVRYSTRRAHGTFPTGTACYASRDEKGVLSLTFDDGTVVQLEGHFYAEGLESSDELYRVEDARAWEALDKAANLSYTR